MASKNCGHSRRRCCNCHETSVELCDSLCGWETWHSSKKFQGKVPQKCLQKPAFFWHIFTQKKKIQKEDIKKSMSLEAKLFPWSYPYCFAVSMKATLEEVIQWDLKWLEEYEFFFCIVFVIPPFVSFSFDCNLLQRPLIFLDRSCSPQRTPAPLNDTQEIHVGHNASNGFKLEIGQLEYRTFLLPAITRKTRKHTYCTWNFCFCANLVCSTYSEFSYQVLQVPITWTKTLDVSVKKGFQHGVPVPQEQRSQQSFSGHGSGSTSTGCLALSSSFAMCGSCVWGFPSELAETGRGRGEKESPSFWEIWSGIVL